MIESSNNSTGKKLATIGTMCDVIEMKMYFIAWQELKILVHNGFDKLLYIIDSLY